MQLMTGYEHREQPCHPRDCLSSGTNQDILPPSTCLTLGARFNAEASGAVPVSPPPFPLRSGRSAEGPGVTVPNPISGDAIIFIQCSLLDVKGEGPSWRPSPGLSHDASRYHLRKGRSSSAYDVTMMPARVAPGLTHPIKSVS